MQAESSKRWEGDDDLAMTESACLESVQTVSWIGLKDSHILK